MVNSFSVTVSVVVCCPVVSVAVDDFEVVETMLGADDSVDGRAVVLPSSTMRVVDGMAGVVVERVVSALSGFVVE